MSATLRLAWTYFTATPLVRGLVLLGSGCVLAGIVSYAVTPVWTLGIGMRQESLFYQAFLLGLPWLGLIALIAATALMPAIVERMARGRSIWILPGGRISLLASTCALALLLALLTAFAATVAFLAFDLGTSHIRIFYRTALMAFVDFGLIYGAIWLVGKTSGIWRLAGMLWVIVSVMTPMRYLNGIPPFSPLEALGLASWIAFGLILLSGGRARHALLGLRTRFASSLANLVPPVGYATGSEIELMLGTTRPWIVALGQLIPIAVMAWFAYESEVWIVFLMIFSAISGAITSQAAARSRRLWLRFHWTREEIGRRVERAYWRYNAYSLAVLLLVFVALGANAGFSVPSIALGAGLLALGSTVCTYLGLMITRGLGWFESALCILTMVALTLAALAIIRQNPTVAVELELLLAALTLAYRSMAKGRWLELDWMQCRFERSARGA